MLCLPTRVCAQPGLAVRAVSAIGAHLELAGRLGMIGLGILRSPDALHSLGLRTEGHSLSRPCASQQGWRRSVVWVSSEQPKRAAVAQLRQASLPVLRHVHWKHCRAARLPSSQPRARRPSRTSSSRAPCRRQVLGAIRGQKTGIFEKRLRVRRGYPWATPPCKRLILGALRGSVGAIHQYLWNGGSFAEFAEGGEPTNES